LHIGSLAHRLTSSQQQGDKKNNAASPSPANRAPQKQQNKNRPKNNWTFATATPVPSGLLPPDGTGEFF